MNLLGIYSGTVLNNADPRQLGRLQLLVPCVFGPTPAGNIAVADLPWAIPAGLPLGQTESSGGMMWLPNQGDRVMVMFLDGEPEKPVWMWGMSDATATKSVLNYSSATTTAGSPATSGQNSQSLTAVSAAAGQASTPQAAETAGTPSQQAVLSRFGHQIQWNPFGIVQSTKGGYGIIFTDSSNGQNNGSVTVLTPLGGLIDISDNDAPPTAGSTLTIQMQNVQVNTVQQWLHYAQTFDFIASRGGVGQYGPPTSSVDSSPSNQGITTAQAGALVTTTTPMGLQADRIVLGYRSAPPAIPANYFSPVNGNTNAGQRGAAPKLDPLVRLSDMDNYTQFLTNWLDNQLTQKLTVYFQQLQDNFATHTHGNGNMGSPTTPPLLPGPEWVIPTPNSETYLKSSQVPTGSPIVFATKAGAT